ncbi:MAG: ParB N-terminal domain-containing protein [Chryseotalea sp. WA131a]|nr:MAG: ParB N-terminal domain-containing protein [Chryseotalea sp. WA131a]
MVNDIAKSLTILKEIKDYIHPLSEEEFFNLEKSILLEGCRDPLIAWQKKDDQLVLVDGHNRYKICKKNNIPFKVKKIDFKDIEEVKIWMVENQMGRRNLTPDQMSYYRGLKYLSLKKKKGGYDNVLSKGQNDFSTSEFLAAQFDISESTIKRDAKFAEGLNVIGFTNPGLKLNILTGKATVKKADVQALTDARNPEKMNIKNEADLYNKAKAIKEEVLQEVEAKVKKIEKQKSEKAQEILKGMEPAFLTREDRLKKIKGMIISAINRAIIARDSVAIKELKKLIGKLATELQD